MSVELWKTPPELWDNHCRSGAVCFFHQLSTSVLVSSWVTWWLFAPTSSWCSAKALVPPACQELSPWCLWYSELVVSGMLCINHCFEGTFLVWQVGVMWLNMWLIMLVDFSVHALGGNKPTNQSNCHQHDYRWDNLHVGLQGCFLWQCTWVKHLPWRPALSIAHRHTNGRCCLKQCPSSPLCVFPCCCFVYLSVSQPVCFLLNIMHLNSLTAWNRQNGSHW